MSVNFRGGLGLRSEAWGLRRLQGFRTCERLVSPGRAWASSARRSLKRAAYLIMVAPLTVARLIQQFLAIRNGEKAPSLYVLTGCYTFLLASQLLCILFTQSRGPLLGLLCFSWSSPVTFSPRCSSP